jgi:hypothetical protein
MTQAPQPQQQPFSQGRDFAAAGGALVSSEVPDMSCATLYTRYGPGGLQRNTGAPHHGAFDASAQTWALLLAGALLLCTRLGRRSS